MLVDCICSFDCFSCPHFFQTIFCRNSFVSTAFVNKCFLAPRVITLFHNRYKNWRIIEIFEARSCPLLYQPFWAKSRWEINSAAKVLPFRFISGLLQQANNPQQLSMSLLPRLMQVLQGLLMQSHKMHDTRTHSR